jgi:hypothetical protein
MTLLKFFQKKCGLNANDIYTSPLLGNIFIFRYRYMVQQKCAEKKCLLLNKRLKRENGILKEEDNALILEIQDAALLGAIHSAKLHDTNEKEEEYEQDKKKIQQER